MARAQKQIDRFGIESLLSKRSSKQGRALSVSRDPRIRPVGGGRLLLTPRAASPANEQDAEAEVEKLFRGIAKVKWPVDQSE
jgi:hypothetical protein